MEELRRIVTEAEERDEAGRVLGTETVLVLAACDFTTTDFGRRKVSPNSNFVDSSSLSAAKFSGLLRESGVSRQQSSLTSHLLLGCWSGPPET